MELGTILAGIIALQFFPFSFLTAPIFFWSSYGLDCLLNRSAKEKGLWVLGYLFGTLTFWSMLTGLCFDKGPFLLFIYFVLNVLAMVLFILLRRKILMILGAFGVFIYFGHFACTIF
jgi:hypothetical protein